MAQLQRLTGLLAGLWIGFGAAAATAQQMSRGELPILGAPEDGGIDFQEPATGLARELQWLDNFLLVIITGITLFVVALLAWTILRHNARANPTPARFTHNTPIEIAWTVVPAVILVFIGAFSLPVLFNQQEIPEGDVVIKVTGHQWHWQYEYPGTDIDYMSYMLARDELQDYGYSQDEFRLATDTAMVIPTGQDIVVQVTAADVIHSFSVPAFGIKQDGIPGRLAEAWFRVEEGDEGVYFGQCYELCGVRHAYMPITVFAVTPEEYEAWLAGDLTEFASTGTRAPDSDVAEAAPGEMFGPMRPDDLAAAEADASVQLAAAE